MADRQRPRREPRFDDDRAGSRDLFVTRDDRPVAGAGDRRRRGGAREADLDGSPRQPQRGRRGRNRRRRSRGLLGGLFYWTLVFGLWIFVGLGSFIAYHATKLPPIDQLAVPKRPPNIAILAADGSLIANRGDTGGRAVTLKELPQHLPNAFIAIEDRRFRHHFGLDPIGITRALVRNVTTGGVMQGGSTLTQQLAKNLFLTQERTASRKVQEAILAVWLERNYSKDQILELYLNRVYFGAGAYGVEAAAQRYFGKSARAVNIAEAATLAGLVQAPSRLAPNRNPEASRARAELVLAAMVDNGFISDNAAKDALMAPAEAIQVAGAGSVNFAADYVMDVIDDVIGTIESDVTVTTTIDPRLQAAAEQALVSELDAKGAKFGVGQGAFVAMSPDGEIRALVGGRNYSQSQFNRATAAKRQPGSAFKPFVYLAALERGLAPASVREDGPVAVKGWRPENFSRDFRGPVTLTEALASSLNTVAVKLAVEVGPRSVAQTAQRLGINSPLHNNASIALGTAEVTPLELVSAYAAFANGGAGIVPAIIRSVSTADGKRIFTRQPAGLGRVVQPAHAAAMNAMLHETLVTGTARRAEFTGWESAGKTGTSQDFRDAWFVGYTSHLVAGVWLGNDDSSPTKRASGSNLPVEIWSRFMRAAHQGVAPRPLFGGPFPAGAPPVPMAEALPSGAVRPAQRQAQDERAWQPPPPNERGLLERLFGG